MSVSASIACAAVRFPDRSRTAAENAVAGSILRRVAARDSESAASVALVEKTAPGLPLVGPRLPLIGLPAGGCHWVHGDPLADHSFCGQQVARGKPYCAAHQARTVDRVPGIKVHTPTGFSGLRVALKADLESQAQCEPPAQCEPLRETCGHPKSPETCAHQNSEPA